MYVVSTFYKFTNIADVAFLQKSLKDCCSKNGINGTILIAQEGVNATVVGKKESMIEFYNFLTTIPNFDDLFFQESFCEFMPFQKLKVKIKSEIVTFKAHDLDMSKTGQYIKPEDWDDFINRDDVKVIDTRNYYEVAMGSFKNAINPNINKFTDLVKWSAENLPKNDRDAPIAMFCTGGVRCEKSTAYLKKLGYTNVYHLRGGIINYLKSKKDEHNTWEGSCFIFDDRIMIDLDLMPTT